MTGRYVLAVFFLCCFSSPILGRHRTELDQTPQHVQKCAGFVNTRPNFGGGAVPLLKRGSKICLFSDDFMTTLRLKSAYVQHEKPYGRTIKN